MLLGRTAFEEAAVFDHREDPLPLELEVELLKSPRPEQSDHPQQLTPSDDNETEAVHNPDVK